MSILRFDPFGDPFRQLDRLTNQMVSGTRTPLGMPMDVWLADDGYHVALDLPGVDPDSVEITSERNVLTIRAERRPEHTGAQEVLVAERPQGSFTRQLQLGDGVDAENVAASYRGGVLVLTVPIAAAAQPRRIQVRREEDRSLDLSSGQQGLTASGPEQSQGSGEGERKGSLVGSSS